MIQEIKLRVGRYLIPVKSCRTNGRLFLDFPFNRKLMDEVRVMEGAQYHGYDGAPNRDIASSIFNKTKLWSVALTDRNNFQLEYLLGGNPYKRWDEEPDDSKINFDRPLYDHQKLMVALGLCRNYMVWGAEMGTGKTLAAIEVMERSGSADWYYIGPKSALKAVEAEFRQWRFQGNVELMTYDGLKRKMKEWPDGKIAPFGVIFDESSLLKTPTSQRSQAAKALADGIRADHSENVEQWWEKGDFDPFVICMTGSPAPKGPPDWWHQCEISAPGFLREGQYNKFKQRLGLYKEQQSFAGGTFQKRITWLDNENKCRICGQFKEDEVHSGINPDSEYHEFQPSVNEVEKLYRRMKGAVSIWFKKDCLDLPEKVYKRITVKALPSTVRAAKLIAKKTSRAAQVLILLRELSDGFQYVETPDGEKECSACFGLGTVKDFKIKEEHQEHYDEYGTPPVTQEDEDLSSDEYREKYYDHVDITCPTCGGNKVVPRTKRSLEEIPCPKDDVVRNKLEQHLEDGRLIIYAGFQGSVDRCVKIAQAQDWTVIKWDGRGIKILGPKGETILGDPLDIFQKKLEEFPRVVFIGQGDSAGMGLTLTASNEILYFSNTFSAQARIQSEDRIHRPGSRGAMITDIIHLPTDELVLSNLNEKRDVQAMSMGDITAALQEAEKGDRVF